MKYNESISDEGEVDIGMLYYFSVKNYKSISSKTVINLLENPRRADAISLDEITLVSQAKSVCTLSGKNGIGKSNLLEALQVLIMRIIQPGAVNSDELNEKIQNGRSEIIPYLFDAVGVTLPTEFEMVFTTKQAVYRYELHIFENVVVREKLMRRSWELDEDELLFTRGADGKVRKYLELKELGSCKDISGKLPLLAFLKLAYGKNDTVKDIFGWLENHIEFTEGIALTSRAIQLLKNEDIKQQVVFMFSELGFDIIDYRIDDKWGEYKVYVTHCVEGYEAEIKLEYESSGIQKVFNVLPFVVKIIQGGGVLVADGLGIGLYEDTYQEILRFCTMVTGNVQILETGV